MSLAVPNPAEAIRSLLDALDDRPWRIGCEANKIVEEVHRDHEADRVVDLDRIPVRSVRTASF